MIMAHNKDDFEVFVNAMFIAFKTLADEKGFDDETTINAAYYTVMAVAADVFTRAMGLDVNRYEDVMLGHKKAEEWIIRIGEEIQKERKNQHYEDK